MRHSVAPNRISQAGGHPNSAAAHAKLLEKKKEYDAVSALERASALYLERIEALGDDCEVMANAGEVHGQVLAQWPKMFQILSQFRESPSLTEDNRSNFEDRQVATRESFNADQESGTSLEEGAEGQRLVRIPIEELQQADTDKQ
ncbi:hypothetical protein D9619_001366 [Psilocybe cf. subviscida]|uniref:DASH complex subunit DAD2 n=1 Tax=Psilocybe cf. subviscida TaxID=2480587 RepID=A0A8H5BHD2_9AGAR|nr:hypothetical protein D9619_001366 [Psilocybe cf. subviscida]